MKSKELNLGEEKISKLLLKFSIPCVISMLVAALYNIVDQIYIGHISEIGVFCNAATNVVYPLTLIALAICLLLGDGAATVFSILKGKKEDKKANKAIGNGLILQIASFVILTILCLVLKEQILNLFGANDEIYQYAYDYLSIIVLGFPLYMFGQGLNSSIRADGSPKYAMIATTAGAIANIILDPIFIFTFNQGIKGAAIATVIGQALTAIITLIYLFRSKNFKINKNSLKLDFKLIKDMILSGIPSLVTQIAIVIIIAVANNVINTINDPYYGTTIPLAVIGIVMKVFGIVISICIGISLGGQPIIGYNSGAKKILRVKETYKYVTLSCLVVGIIAMIIFEFLPDLIINIFSSENSEVYINFARLCIRIYLGGIVLTCFTKSGTIFLQACGSKGKAMILSIARDVLFFVPATLIIGLNFGLIPMLWSSIIADILSAICCGIFIKMEFTSLEKIQLSKNEENQ